MGWHEINLCKDEMSSVMVLVSYFNMHIKKNVEKGPKGKDWKFFKVTFGYFKKVAQCWKIFKETFVISRKWRNVISEPSDIHAESNSS